MLIIKGDTGRTVKEIQSLLKASGYYTGEIDGKFGKNTEDAVKRFQKSNNIKVDGIVGPTTYNLLLKWLDSDSYSVDVNDTDDKLNYLGSYKTNEGLEIDRAYLDSDEYVRDYGIIKPKYLFIHHTAGWDNPYNTANIWNTDNRGRVGTQFIIGGLNIKGDSKYDGKVVETFPNGYIAWHLGKVGNFNVSKYSVGIELNNFGYLIKRDGEFYNYVGHKVPKEQVIDLGYKFRGHQYWHQYSDKQIESLHKLILHIKRVYPTIDIYSGLPNDLNIKTPLESFEFNEDVYYGRISGLYTHANVRKDKFDCYPHPELVKMLCNL